VRIFHFCYSSVQFFTFTALLETDKAEIAGNPRIRSKDNLNANQEIVLHHTQQVKETRSIEDRADVKSKMSLRVELISFHEKALPSRSK